MTRLGKNDVVSIEDLTTVDIERIFELADSFVTGLERGERIDRAQGLIMATLFYEPSTRTRLSFESAMHRLGGAVISSPDMQASSAAKGESSGRHGARGERLRRPDRGAPSARRRGAGRRRILRPAR